MARFDEFLGAQLIQLMRPHRYLIEQQLNALGLHAGQEIILFQLWQQDGLTQSELAQLLEVTAPTVTKMLRGLEAGCIVHRQPDSTDARVMRVYLTPKGRALQAPVTQLWAAVEQRMLAGISEPELLLLRRLLAQMRANLR